MLDDTTNMNNSSDKKNDSESDILSEEQLMEKEEAGRLKLLNADVLSALILFLLSLYVMAEGLRMILLEDTGTDVWYYSPGIYPLFVGSVLLVLSGLLFIKKKKAGGKLVIRLDTLKSFQFRFDNVVTRIIIAIALLALYVFVLIGRIPFLFSTFIYLSATMIIFRDGKIAIWKLLIISAVVASVIFAFFHYVAAIPLP